MVEWRRVDPKLAEAIDDACTQGFREGGREQAIENVT